MIDIEGFKIRFITGSKRSQFNNKVAQYLCLIGAVCLFNANDAKACSVCMTAMLDDILPPVGIWCLFSVGWFLCASFVVTLHETSIIGIPKLWKSILSILLCVIASLFIGPIFLLILLFPCLISAITIFLTSKKYNHRFAIHYKIISSFGVLCFIFLIGFSAYIQNTRSDIDFILKWSNTYAGKAKFIELYNKDSKGLIEIKEVFKRSDTETVTRLCDSLSMHFNFEEEPSLKELCQPYMEE